MTKATSAEPTTNDPAAKKFTLSIPLSTKVFQRTENFLKKPNPHQDPHEEFAVIWALKALWLCMKHNAQTYIEDFCLTKSPILASVTQVMVPLSEGRTDCSSCEQDSYYDHRRFPGARGGPT